MQERLPQHDKAAMGIVVMRQHPLMSVVRGGAKAAVDPVVLAATIVVRLQTIVSREVAPTDTVVLTIGSIHAGTKAT